MKETIEEDLEIGIPATIGLKPTLAGLNVNSMKNLVRQLWTIGIGSIKTSTIINLWHAQSAICDCNAGYILFKVWSLLVSWLRYHKPHYTWLKQSDQQISLCKQWSSSHWWWNRFAYSQYWFLFFSIRIWLKILSKTSFACTIHQKESS